MTRTTLVYQAGKSDKVYEVDLCRLGENRYVVNFRYGRRGTALKEGSKTVQPIPMPEAQRLFDQLVSSKISQGYRDAEQAAADVQVPVGDRLPRHQAILDRLANRNNQRFLERAIWRAGELKLRAATPLLIPLIGTGDALRDYCLAWALGWCGDRRAIPLLSWMSQADSPDVRRIAWEALFKLSDQSSRAALRAQKIEQLPSQLRMVINGESAAFATALQSYLNSSDYRRFAVLDTLYQIDNKCVRPALLDFLSTAPLQPNSFQRLRHIFKMAEYRHDAEVFAILAYAFEKHPGTFDNQRTGWHYDRVRRRYHRVGERLYTQELKSPRSSKAYSQQTREYLRRRVWRTLKQLGEAGDPDYIPMAVAVLLQYSDQDAQAVKQRTFYRWNRTRYTSDRFSYTWDAYASYLTFNHILYEHSPRYESHPRAWRCREGYQPGGEPQGREEAFPKAWQQHPEALLRLLVESKCSPVHQFAVKALRDCQGFCERLEVETVIELVGKPYAVTVTLGFELAVNLYRPTQPNCDLVLALANSILPAARSQAYQWLEQQREFFNTSHLASLVTSSQAETRAFARRLLSFSILSDTAARVLIGQIIAQLLSRSAVPQAGTIAAEIGETLLLSFTPQLRSLGFNVILDLLEHPLPEIQIVGARILLNHDTPAAELPPDLIETLLASSHETVRGLGVRIFGQLPDAVLLGDRLLLLAMAVNAVPDIRSAIRPVIRRLAADHPTFSREFAIDLIDLLTTPQRHQGVHKDLVSLLREIPGWMRTVPLETVMELVHSKASATQELGGEVLRDGDRFVGELDTATLVKLANREVASVRQAARSLFSQKLDSIHTNSEEMLSAIRLLESKWDDTREFAFHVFGDRDKWTPEVAIGVCDSTREDVRRFGRDLVTRNFQQSDGQEYLCKFSEHPTTDMQMFVTNYLENYAANRCDRISQLKPYFITVLAGVNRGRVAKQRIFNFLEAEALKSEVVARVVAEILTQQSLTVAIADKAKAIQIMLKIRKHYLDIDVPLQVKETELRI